MQPNALLPGSFAGNAPAPQAAPQAAPMQHGGFAFGNMGGGNMGWNMGALGAAMGDYRNALMDWRAARPSFSLDPASDASPMQQRLDFRPQMADWRQQRPAFPDFFNFGVMSPGGGTAGAPLQPQSNQIVSQLPITPGY